MKKIFIGVLMLSVVVLANAQTFEYVHPDFEIKATAIDEEECCFDHISRFTGGAFVTLPSSIKENAASRRYSKADLKEESRFYLDKELTHNGEDLDLLSIKHLPNGNIMFLASYYDEKRSTKNLYSVIHDSVGDYVETNFITKVAAAPRAKVSFGFMESGDRSIVYCMSYESERKPYFLDVIEVDKNNDELSRQRSQIDGKARYNQFLLSNEYGSFYVLSEEKITSTFMGATVTKSEFTLQKFGLDELGTSQKLLQFKEFTLNSCELVSINNKIYITGLAGPSKNHTSINSTYLIEIDKNTLEPTENMVFIPIAKHVVDGVKQAKSFFTVLSEAPNAANFTYLTKHVDGDRFIAIYENIYSGGHSGHYIVSYDMKEKTSFQNYIPNIGWGNCISRVDEEGSLHLYFVTDSKPFAKYLPNLEGVSPTGMYNKFLIEVVVDKTNKTSFRNIFNTKTDFKSYYLSVASVQLVNDALVVYLQVMGQSKYGRIGFIQVSEKMR